MISQPEKIYRSISGAFKKLRPTRTPAAWWNISDWISLAAMLVTLGIAVWSVDQAGWIRPSTSLVTVLLVSILAGFALVKTGLPAIILHPAALLSGLLVIFCLGLILLPDPGVQLRASHLVSDLQSWWHAQVYGAPSPVTIHIALIFGYVTWLIGYFSTWFLIKKGNPWIAIFLGTIVVLINLNFWTRDKYYFFLIYIIAALLFLALVTFLNNRRTMARNNFSGSRTKPVYWLAVALSVIIVSVSLAWVNPGYKIEGISTYARAHNPFKGTMEVYWQSFFAPVPGSGVPVLSHGGQQELLFGGPLDLSDQVVFIINTDSPQYWKTQVYDFYTSSGWKTSDTQSETIPAAVSSPVVNNSSADNELIYTLIPQVNTDVLPTPGELVSANIAVKENIFKPQLFTLDMINSSNDALLPADLASAASSIRNVRSNRRRTDQQIAALLPPGLKLESVIRSGLIPQTITVSRIETGEKTAAALSSAQVMLQQKRAAIEVTLPPPATDSSLEAAGTAYPLWVTDRYLQLPGTLPSEVSALAADITKSSSTPFQKTQDIKKYLATLRYDLSINAPPDGADGVDYFLFTQKSGYCNYFASAATVMLRSIGIPARMVVGFLSGQYDSSTHSYIIRDRDYHAWTEVYYPGRGWIELDTTPSGQGLSSPEISSDSSQYIPYPPFPTYIDSSQGVSSTASGSQPNNDNLFHLILFMSCYLLAIGAIIGWFYYSTKPKNKTAIYSRMVLLASLAGLGPKPRQTELEFSRQLSLALPRQADTITRIAQSFMTYRYSRAAPDLPMEKEFKKSWPGLRLALIKRIFRFH